MEDFKIIDRVENRYAMHIKEALQIVNAKPADCLFFLPFSFYFYFYPSYIHVYIFSQCNVLM